MFKWLLLISLILFMPGCAQQQLDIPPLVDDTVLITHLKEPAITVIDTKKETVIHEETVDFFIDSFTYFDEEQIIFTGSAADEVKLLNIHTGEIDTLLADVGGITGLFLHEQSNTLYLSDAKLGEIIVFSMETKTIEKRIPVGAHPSVMKLYNDALYVLAEKQASIFLIDLKTQEVTDTLTVLDNPTDFLILEELEEIWVVGHGEYGNLNRDIHIYEQATGRFKEKITAGSMPIALHADEYANDVFVISHGSHELYIYESETKTLRAQMNTALNPYQLTADEQFIYVTALDGDELLMVDRNDFTVEQRYPLPNGPYGIIIGGYAQ